MKTEAYMQNESQNNDSTSYWNACLEQVARCRDKQIYMTFYDHFAPRLNSWLLGMTRDDALAEEIVQETMINVWRKAEQYDSSKAAASTWVFRIGRNLYLDHMRKATVRERAQTELKNRPADSHDQLNLDGNKVMQEIAKLPVQQAQVIYKSYFEGKSHQEIAWDMDLPLGSVKSSLRLAFQKLSKVLRPEDVS